MIPRRADEDAEDGGGGQTAAIGFTLRSAVALRSTMTRSSCSRPAIGRREWKAVSRPGRGMYLQPGSVIERPLATGGRRHPASSRMASATRSGGIPILSPEYCTCISVATRPGQRP
jgi:hypothetical protein